MGMVLTYGVCEVTGSRMPERWASICRVCRSRETRSGPRRRATSRSESIQSLVSSQSSAPDGSLAGESVDCHGESAVVIAISVYSSCRE